MFPKLGGMDLYGNEAPHHLGRGREWDQRQECGNIYIAVDVLTGSSPRVLKSPWLSALQVQQRSGGGSSTFDSR